MARKKPAPPPPARVPMSRDEWALAFERKVDELRPGMGSKKLREICTKQYRKILDRDALVLDFHYKIKI